MKLKFKKDNDNIKVSISDNETIFDFDYIRMINILYNEHVIEPADFEGDFSEEEINSINMFVKEISDKIVSAEQVLTEC